MALPMRQVISGSRMVLGIRRRRQMVQTGLQRLRHLDLVLLYHLMFRSRSHPVRGYNICIYVYIYIYRERENLVDFLYPVTPSPYPVLKEDPPGIEHLAPEVWGGGAVKAKAWREAMPGFPLLLK